MDRYAKNALWLYWIRGDDEEVLTDDEFSNLQEENLCEGNEIAEIFRIETDIFLFEAPLCKEFKEFNHLLQIDVDVLTGDLPGFKMYEDYKNTWYYEWNNKVPWVDEKPWLEDGIWKNLLMIYVMNASRLVSKVDMLNGPLVTGEKMDIGKKEESSEDVWSNYLPNDEWEHYEHTTYIKTDVNSNYDTYNNVCQIFKNCPKINNDNDAIQANQEWFDDHEPMEDDDDDIGDLDRLLDSKKCTLLCS
ncbi:hypothetical protein Tco_0155489 [Tanacetum coccineum]